MERGYGRRREGEEEEEVFGSILRRTREKQAGWERVSSPELEVCLRQDRIQIWASCLLGPRGKEGERKDRTRGRRKTMEVRGKERSNAHFFNHHHSCKFAYIDTFPPLYSQHVEEMASTTLKIWDRTVCRWTREQSNKPSELASFFSRKQQLLRSSLAHELVLTSRNLR